MHIDMNAFFASVEQQSNPFIKGKPVAVIGSNKRTIIVTASYEARKFGIKTGMMVHEAKKLCKELILVEADNQKYTDTSVRINSILENYTSFVEVYSIDEAFLDITGSLKLFGTPENIARSVKNRIRKEFGLSCSIGIAPNKLLAKLASDMKKPDGLVIINPEDVKDIIGNLSIGELWGIGHKLEKHLNAMGIKTCSELAKTDTSLLRSRFGIIGEHLKRMGQGIDESPVVPSRQEPDPKSIGHSMTFDRDYWDRKTLKCYLLQLSEMVGRRLRKGLFSGKTVTLTIRYSDFNTFSKQKTLKRYIDTGTEIYLAILGIFDSIELKKSVRLLGVSISGLIKNSNQLPLFERELKKSTAVRAMDVINNRYGEFAVTWGTLLSRYNHDGVISPGWRPEGIKKIEYS